MTIGYFLHRAREQNPDSTVDIGLYTYPGPRPQSKETALLMLADGSEAAVRSMSDHSLDAIRAMVKRIVQERIDQGELDDAPLTLRDLDRTQRAFCSVLNGLYHPRVEYPEPATTEIPAHAPIALQSGAPTGRSEPV